MRLIRDNFRDAFTRRDAIYLICAFLLVALYALSGGGGFPLDDSWIHQVYGRNLARLGEWAFVPGEPTAASTAPLYTVLLAIGYFFHLPYALWTHLLGTLALTAAGIISAHMADQVLELLPLPHRKLIAFITGLALIFSWHLIWAAASGMETMLFSTFTLALMWLAWREIDARSTNTRNIIQRGAVFGVVAALATLTRPEGLLLAGLVGLLMLGVRPQKSWRGTILWGVGAGIAGLIVISPYLLLNLHLTGGLLPATADAKYAQHAPLLQHSYFKRLLAMTVPILAGAQLLIVPGMLFYVVRLWRDIRVKQQAIFLLLPFLWALSLIAVYAARLPASYQHGRYVIPALPSLMIMGCIGMVGLVVEGKNSLIGRVLTRAIGLSAAIALIYFGCILGPKVYRQDVHIIDEEMVAPAHWIAANIPLDELLAVHDIGAVGYFASRPILDIAGLVSPEVVPIINNDDALWTMLTERGVVYLMAFPDQIPGNNPNDSRLCPVYESPGRTAINAGGAKMRIYRFSWDGLCEAS